MRISFVLPGPGNTPVGGFKVVYEYANGLANRGHHVCIVHSPSPLKGKNSFLSASKRWASFLSRTVLTRRSFRPDSWFRVAPQVILRWSPSLHERWIPDGDVVIATAWETAEWVGQYSLRKGRKYYLIQHNESSFKNVDAERAMATWKLPLRKVVIAKWLHEIAINQGESADYIPNGLDFDQFNLDIPIETRLPCQLIMLFHDQEWKGTQDGLDAIVRVKHSCPELNVTLFGIPSEPSGLPEWIHYSQNPTQAALRRMYNEAAIFVGPSWAEGWPLPPAEALQCGAAVCLTDIGGHREYALPGKTALLSPPKDPRRLAEDILRLIEDQELRIQLATQGNEYIQSFTWDKAVDALEDVISEG